MSEYEDPFTTLERLFQKPSKEWTDQDREDYIGAAFHEGMTEKGLLLEILRRLVVLEWKVSNK